MAPRKILLMKLRSLGDTVLMTAPLEELKRAYPEAELHVAVKTPWAALFEDYPGVHKVWTYDRHKETTARAKALARLAFRLRKERFDYVVNLHASPSSATLAFATGARTRSIHFHGHKDRNRYSTVLVPGKGMVKPVIERDMDTIRALGLHVPAGRTPRIHLETAEKTKVAEEFVKLGATAPIMAIGLGSSRPVKCWPVERFAALAVSWCRQENGSIFAAVAADESELLHQFLKEVEEYLNATVANPQERATIRQRMITETAPPLRRLAAVLSQVAVYAGNDAGPKHLSVAAQTPTVTVFGPEAPFEWHPYSKDMHPYFFVKDLPCRKDGMPGMPPWCGLHTCDTEQHKCMRNIGVEEVLDAARRVAKRSS